MRLMQSGKTAEALAHFERVAADNDGKFNDPKLRYYSARTMPESLFYATQMAAQGASKGIVIAANWGYAHYLKGYALVALRRRQCPSLAPVGGLGSMPDGARPAALARHGRTR